MFAQTACHIPELSRDAYNILEDKFRTLKFKTLSLAMTNAHLQRHPVWRDDVDCALRELSATGIDFPSDKTEPSITAPLEISLYLVKRLHPLRMLVFRWAVRIARTDNSSEENALLVLSPENIRSAWSTVASKRLLVHCVLVPSDAIG